MMRRESPFTLRTQFFKSIYPAWHAPLSDTGGPDSTRRPSLDAPTSTSITSPLKERDTDAPHQRHEPASHRTMALAGGPTEAISG